MSRPHVVIIGGGFAGLTVAQRLSGAPVRITLLDRRNHHLFQPLLYQVATGTLNPSDIATPIRRILRGQENVTVLLGEVTAIDKTARALTFSGQTLNYDYLIVATGATHSYFGHSDWAAAAPGLKTIEDALEIRRRVFLAYEAAELEPDAERRKEWMTFIIVGAGPTGVELAGALAEISRHSLARDFQHIDPAQARIILLEGTAAVLPPMPPDLQVASRTQLEHLGVEVRTSATVTAIDSGGVKLGDERIPARTVIWAAGVAASPLAKSLDVPLDRQGRVMVGNELTIPGANNVYVIGDLAHVEQDGKLLPGVAPVAMQQGRYVAHMIRRLVGGQNPEPFHYTDKGSLATIGRNAAVADLGFTHLTGFLAWMAWLLIHVFFLIGFRNRFFVLCEWAYAYFFFERGARLITGAPEKDPVH